MKPLVVVTGVNGQLGWELQQLAPAFNSFDFLFTNRDLLDLEDIDSIPFFSKKINLVILLIVRPTPLLTKRKQKKPGLFTSMLSV